MAVKKVKRAVKKAKKPIKKAVKKVVKKAPAKKVVKKAVKKVAKKAPAKKVVTKVVKKAAPVAKAATAAAKPLVPAPVITQPRIKAWHVVAAGDTPSTITQKYYGSTEPAKWTAIYEINKTAIGPDPNQLRPGMVLRIPEA
ncbi:MAG: LysM peptidoglycan-binding domain-containing protein [Chloroflexi bacterium]|nr:LysM peptidoglycan-binding domain-containing protein [Chloroflexota bacterium]